MRPFIDSLQSLRTLLLRREEELRHEVDAAQRAARERQGEGAHEVVDRKDEAGERIEATLGEKEIARDVEELRQIAAARQRLSDGSYGYCVDCGDAIDLRRLLAQPAAARCTGCQTLAESGHRSSRRP
jgi:DnaK suppressor protein